MLHNPNWDGSNRGRDLLLKAAELIETHGHVKNDMGEKGRGFCISGAIREASYDSMTNSTWSEQVNESRLRVELLRHMRVELLRHIGKLLPLNEQGSVYAAISWNNRPERTKEEVIAILRKSAETVPATLSAETV